MFTLNFVDYLAVEFLSLVGSWLGSFLQGYLGTKGQNLATKEDFHELLRQTAETTKLTERIRADLSSRQWVSQESWRMKSEVYMSLLTMLSRHAEASFQVAEALRGSRPSKDVQVSEVSVAERERIFVLLQLVNPDLISLLQPIKEATFGAERNAEEYLRWGEAYRKIYFAVADAARKDLGLERSRDQDERA